MFNFLSFSTKFFLISIFLHPFGFKRLVLTRMFAGAVFDSDSSESLVNEDLSK